MRRDARFEASSDSIASEIIATAEAWGPPADDESGVDDDRLRLIFTCCHPALALDAQVGLTLRTICGLTTDEIARAFLVPVPTMAQRLELRDRLDAVLAVVYLVFTEGYAATGGDELVRRDLCGEAIRLARIIVELMPTASEANGLLALMLLHDARRHTRVTDDGEVALLENQDRSRWDRAQIDEGLGRVEAALDAGQVGSYAIQAAIAALHARAPSANETDWRQIVALYALLLERAPSAVVELNHAVAVAMTDGPESGLLLLDAIDARGELHSYHLLHAARADLLRRMGRVPESVAAFEQALELAILEPERRFLQRRLRELRSRD